MDIVERLDEHLRFNGKDQLSRDAKGAIERLRDALKELLNVIPNFPPDGNFLVGMKERYNKALIEARAALKEGE